MYFVYIMKNMIHKRENIFSYVHRLQKKQHTFYRLNCSVCFTVCGCVSELHYIPRGLNIPRSQCLDPISIKRQRKRKEWTMSFCYNPETTPLRGCLCRQGGDHSHIGINMKWRISLHNHECWVIRTFANSIKEVPMQIKLWN